MRRSDEQRRVFGRFERSKIVGHLTKAFVRERNISSTLVQAVFLSLKNAFVDHYLYPSKRSRRWHTAIGTDGFVVDRFLADSGIEHVDLLHSDIQGAELEMLDGANRTLGCNVVDYVFISTHSDQLHFAVIERLRSRGYRVEVDSNFGRHTTSFDGFVLAASPSAAAIFGNLQPLGRLEIANASSAELVRVITDLDTSVSA